jgi:multidrug efflux pump subunit AcrB
MSRFYVLTLTLVILGIIAFALGWFNISTSSDSSKDKMNVNLTLDKGKVKEDAAATAAKARELSAKTEEEIRDVARKIGSATDTPTWTVDRKRLELQAGTSADVTLTRHGSDLKTLQVGLFPSTGSKLIVTGGLFKEGEKTAMVAVEAPAGASDGQISIVADGRSEILDVVVKPQ